MLVRNSPVVQQMLTGRAVALTAGRVFPMTGIVASGPFHGAVVTLHFSRPVRLPIGAPILRHRSDQESGPVALSAISTPSTTVGTAVRSMNAEVNLATGDVLAFAVTPCLSCSR
jgi:hypothetical protein